MSEPLRFEVRAFLVRMQCPQCAKILRPVSMLHYATQAIDRTCPKCKTAWRVVVRPGPYSYNHHSIHVAEWTSKGKKASGR